MFLSGRWSLNDFIILYFVSVTTSSSPLDFCKLENGGRTGRCIESKKCPQTKTLGNCTNQDQVCCQMMERIVTPNNPMFPSSSISPPMYTPLPFPVSFPPIPPTPLSTFSSIIVPPSATFPSITDPPSVTVTPVSPNAPIVQTSSSAYSNEVVNAKCEEYKHIVKKRESVVTYVFGGTQSQSKEFPHMAALTHGLIGQTTGNEFWFCGGSLISEQFVLTAGHCVMNSNVNTLRVRLGDLNLQASSDDANAQEFSVSQAFVHPQFFPPVQYNDIALLKLSGIARFTEYVAPICMQTNYNLPNTDFIATGWGRTEIDDAQSDTLLQVNLDYFSNAACNTNYATISPASLPMGIVDASQICAGSDLPDRDTCQGDSGGPLQIQEGGVTYLVGVTVFGKACGVANSPAVYTRVSYFIPWIQQIVWP